jgi:streptogramin lyase
MNKLFLSIIAILLVGFSATMAQTIELYTSDNSDLPYNQVYCIAFDNQDNIWFGGQKSAATGIAMVSKLSADLSEWTVYSQNDLGLPEDRVFYITVDDQDNAWFCTHYGVTVVPSDGAAEIVDFTNNMYTRTVHSDSKGNVYISQREDDRADARIHVTEDYGETWNMWGLDDIGIDLSAEDARPEIYDLKEDSEGQLWLCTWYGVTYRNTEGTWNSIKSIEGDWTYAMTIDPDDHVWVPNNSTQELYEIWPDETVSVHDSTTLAPLKHPVLDLEADVNGHLWLATDGGGLVEIKPNGTYNQYTYESTEGNIPSNTLTHMEIHNKVIWASSDTAGIVRIAGLIPEPTAVVESPAMEQTPVDFTLYPNYPNPFNPGTTIRFELPRDSRIRLVVYDLIGRQVKELAAGPFTRGLHQVQWDGTADTGHPVPSGVYLYRLEADGIHTTQKMTLIK